MAKQRQTNVNINYTVTTVDLERGNALLNRASKSTDELRKTTETYGKQAAAGYRFASKSVEGMSLEVARLKQQVKLASTQNSADIQRLSAQYRSAKTQLDAYNRSLFETQRASKQTATAAQGMATQFGEVYTAIKTIIAAGLARELVATTLEMAKLSGTVEGVTIAFNKLPNATLLLESLRKATHGTVNDLELMQKALRANNFKIPLQQLGVLLEFAAVKAQQTGQEVNHLVEYIVSGIGYRSIKRLDDLGFTANRVNKALGDVSLQAASMGEIMNAVTKLMNEDLQQTGGFAETAATKVGEIETKYHELRVALAQKFENSALLEFFEKALEGAKALVDSMPMKELGALFSLNWKKLHPVFIFGQITDVFAAWKQGLQDVAEQQNINKNATEEAARIEKRFADLTTRERIPKIEEEIKKKQAAADAYFHHIQALEMTEDKYSDQAIALRLNYRELEATIKILKEYRKAQDAVVDDGGEKEKGNGEGRGHLMKPLRQVVDIRFKDPMTGAITKEHGDKVLNDFAMRAQGKLDSIGPLHIDIGPGLILDSEWEKALERNRADIINLSSNIVQEQVDSVLMTEIDSYNARIDATRAFYDEQIALAGDNKRAKDELRIKEEREVKKLEIARAEREKKAAKAGILVNTALGIMKAFATSVTIYDGIIQAALVAAEGASQFAVASRARYYAKGVIDLQGPGTETSDSIPAMLSKRESVMTAEETKSSMGIFKAVRAKTLNDRVLKEIMSGRSGGSTATKFDDSSILKKLDEVKNATPDITRQGNLIYETRKYSDNYKKTIRSKSMGL